MIYFLQYLQTLWGNLVFPHFLHSTSLAKDLAFEVTLLPVRRVENFLFGSGAIKINF